ncbi:hypothetical protein AB5I39_02095 [Sphingomonas sp. MMS24-J45]|uniref:hypothetical protein n=1 Tax=Sphingomonas sp. MMS24-J45 TaxID=3238806 RepID=UPI00384D7BDE
MATTPESANTSTATEHLNAAAKAAGSAADETAKATVTASQLLKDSAAKIGKEAVDRAKTYAEDRKAAAGGALDEIVKMINDAAGTVDEKLGDQYGQYARTAADKVAGFSEGLKAKELDDLIEDARGFVQKSPAIAIGTAAALGFVLVRLIQSGLAAESQDKA